METRRRYMPRSLYYGIGLGMMIEYATHCPSSPLDYQTLPDLLEKQRKGKFLTFEEKKYLQKYAEEQRKKNLQKKQCRKK